MRILHEADKPTIWKEFRKIMENKKNSPNRLIVAELAL
jgi:hypothetical protein